MTAFGYDLALLARPGGAGRMANVRKLMRLAREFERHEGRDLAAFLLAAAESAKRDEREGMAPVRAEGHDGVRVMTVHAAKGLQFPVVAVPDLGRSLSAGHSWSDVTIGPMPRQERERQRFGMRLVFPSSDSFGLWELSRLNREEAEAEAEEGCRLVYVAATRAEDRLILSGAYDERCLEQGERKPSDSPLRRLLPKLCERGWAGGDGEVELPAPHPGPGHRAGPALGRRAPPPGVGDPPRPRPRRVAVRAPAGGGGDGGGGRRRATAADERAPAPGARRPPLLLGARRVRALRVPLLRRAAAGRSPGRRGRRDAAGRRGRGGGGRGRRRRRRARPGRRLGRAARPGTGGGERDAHRPRALDPRWMVGGRRGRDGRPAGAGGPRRGRRGARAGAGGRGRLAGIGPARRAGRVRAPPRGAVRPAGRGHRDPRPDRPPRPGPGR